jgi:pimeloyl-ACP methyl ester carboxylesterase
MGKVFSRDGTSIAFSRWGEGQPVILVDGAFCSRVMGPTPELAPLLAKHFTVIGYDRRGRNESGDTLPYAVEREVEDMDALIQEAGGSVYVFGLSSGAALAMEAARKFPAKIKKLALYEPPFMVDEKDPRPPADSLERLKENVAANRRGEAVEYFMKMTGTPIEVIASMRQAPVWKSLEAVAHTLVYDCTIMGDYSFPAGKAAGITTPTLIMDGGASPAWAHNTARVIADTLPNVQRRTLPGQRHDVAPQILAVVLEEFFAA